MRLALTACLLTLSALCAEPSPNLLANPSFEDEPAAGQAAPKGWSIYAGVSPTKRLTLVPTAHEGKLGLRVDKDDNASEVGLVQSVPAKGDLVYRAGVWVYGLAGLSSAGSYLQMRFLPSQQYHQVSLTARSGAWRECHVTGRAPAGTTQVTIYLYCHRDPTPHFIMDDATLVSGAAAEVDTTVPDPVPPEITRLKDLCRTTPLAANGQATSTIITARDGRYRAAAERLQAGLKALCGVTVPIADDASPAAAVPLTGHLICLGNRSTNQTISKLYDLHYTLLDLKWPGPGGWAVRSLHSPFGDGRNVLFAGASDDAGVPAAVEALLAELKKGTVAPGALSAGWLMATKLSDRYQVPTDIKQVETWEASDGYGSSGYFGWNMISKRLALYYMTGNPLHAREALRLAFPDQQAKDELAAIDGEMIENKDEPLAGPYHYNAHFMMLYWNLVEASDVFSDAERLKVTQSFAHQLNHRKDEGVYGLRDAPDAVGSRHGQWSAVSLYVIGRYFNTYYPHPVWKQCVRGAMLHFAPLAEHAWLQGELDHLFWYNTGIAPVFAHMILTGDRRPLESGTAARLLAGQEMLLSGRKPDWALNSAALSYFHHIYHLTGDRRWLEYRRRTRLNTDGFRVGQSFWPADDRGEGPADLVGKWSVQPLPEPLWAGRGNGFPLDQSFFHASYRSAPDASGDFLLVKGFNGASRNPYHTFALLQLRLAGQTIIDQHGGAFLNQVQTKADGMVEPQVAMDGALRAHDVLGRTAYCIGEVPKQSFCNWRRSIALRPGAFTLVVDDLTYRVDSENFEAKTLWQGPGLFWDARSQALLSPVAVSASTPAGWRGFGAMEAQVTGQPGDKELITLAQLGIKLVRATKAGDWIEMAFTVPTAVEGNVYADLLNYRDRGYVRFKLDGRAVGEEYEHWTPEVQFARVPLGRLRLAPGEHRLRVEVSRLRDGVDRAFIGLAGLSVQPPGAPAAAAPASAFEIRPCDVLPVTTDTGTPTFVWRGPAKSGQHRIDFSLIARRGGDPAAAAACLRLADNAAMLALPAPALAVVGEYGATRAELAVLGADHAFARQCRTLGVGQAALTASAPVDLDWDLRGGDLHLVCAQAVTLKLPAGERQLPAGRHHLTGVTAALTAEPLAALLTQAQERRRKEVAATAAGAVKTGEVAAAWTAKVAGKPAAVALAGSGAEQRVYVASDQTITVLDAARQALGQWTCDGRIRVLHWWPEAKLLIAGCVDEKVVAFDATGQKRWVFTSVMDEAVFRAAKQYWFKSAPGHEGIHGLTSGPFTGDQPTLFVGSACTLELLATNGQLIRRFPVFWGPGTVLKVVDGPQGTHNLLLGRWPNDSHALAVLNSKTLNPNERGFAGVPSGHTYVGAWCAQNRGHLLSVDLEGDGKQEIVSEVNGTWNRVTVWSATGEPLASANFGPGPSAPARTVRAVVVSDLNGDGKQEIAVGLADGLVLVLDSRCRRLWAKRLPSAPETMVALSGPARLLVASENGGVTVLNGNGETVATGALTGRPVWSGKLADGTVLVAGDRGELKAFRP